MTAARGEHNGDFPGPLIWRKAARTRVVQPAYMMTIGRRGLVVVMVSVATVLATLTALATPAMTARERRGQALLERMCASCHAIGRTGTSAHRTAPPFRRLGQRYAIDQLQEALAEGIMSGHPDMPEFKFSAADAGAVIAYLKLIQEQ